MDEELISKKELLELTGISYGQLYRWKRKNIIPEEWFIKKSSFTGQETFFPKDRIIERVNKIKDMKDDFSLDDLAETFSTNPADMSLTKEELLKRNIVTQNTLNIYEALYGVKQNYDFDNMLYIFTLERFLMSGEVSFEEAQNILKTLADNYPKLKGRDCEVLFLRKLGIGISMIILMPSEFYYDDSVKLIKRIKISSFIEELKLKLNI